MKNVSLSFLLFFVGNLAQGLTKSPLENVVITYEKAKTQVNTYKNGELRINVSPKDVVRFETNGVVSYSDFGVKGDGKSDDIDAIAACHAFANEHGLSVKGDEGATYYIGGKNRTANIRTDTDSGKATFIVDDTNVENRNANVFIVSSSLQPFKPGGKFKSNSVK